jgi:arsenate reductase-like glutaredoxin family protein
MLFLSKLNAANIPHEQRGYLEAKLSNDIKSRLIKQETKILRKLLEDAASTGYDLNSSVDTLLKNQDYIEALYHKSGLLRLHM